MEQIIESSSKEGNFSSVSEKWKKLKPKLRNSDKIRQISLIIDSIYRLNIDTSENNIEASGAFTIYTIYTIYMHSVWENYTT